jgi:hypothetical protein
MNNSTCKKKGRYRSEKDKIRMTLNGGEDCKSRKKKAPKSKDSPIIRHLKCHIKSISSYDWGLALFSTGKN